MLTLFHALGIVFLILIILSACFWLIWITETISDIATKLDTIIKSNEQDSEL